MFQAKAADKIREHILCSIPFFGEKCGLWDEVKKRGGARQAQTTIRRMRFAYSITKARHSEYVILAVFSRSQLFRERVFILSYTYIACLLIVMRGTHAQLEYFHTVRVILNDKLQCESNKPYGPPTSVTWLQLQCITGRVSSSPHPTHLWRGTTTV